MSAPDEDQLWQEFPQVVNMTSRALADRLRPPAPTEDPEAMPDQAGQPTGRQVLHVLGKRHGDLTGDDRRVMQKVVDNAPAERPGDREPVAGQAPWRHRLMSLGHDPLKPA